MTDTTKKKRRKPKAQRKEDSIRVRVTDEQKALLTEAGQQCRRRALRVGPHDPLARGAADDGGRRRVALRRHVARLGYSRSLRTGEAAGDATAGASAAGGGAVRGTAAG